MALYPGTALYEQAKNKGLVSDAVWFENKNAGVFLRDDGQVKRWMNELLSELASIKKKSRYREEDFRKHRQVVGDDCWVTDILEGDYYCENKHYAQAEKIYRRVISRYQHNPWGYLRMASLKLAVGERKRAEQLYVRVKEIVPQAIRKG